MKNIVIILYIFLMFGCETETLNNNVYGRYIVSVKEKNKTKDGFIYVFNVVKDLNNSLENKKEMILYDNKGSLKDSVELSKFFFVLTKRGSRDIIQSYLVYDMAADQYSSIKENLSKMNVVYSEDIFDGGIIWIPASCNYNKKKCQHEIDWIYKSVKLNGVRSENNRCQRPENNRCHENNKN